MNFYLKAKQECSFVRVFCGIVSFWRVDLFLSYPSKSLPSVLMRQSEMHPSIARLSFRQNSRKN
jgi:hypothetical protein